MTQNSRSLAALLMLMAAALISGCTYNPFTDPNSYVGPGPVERVPLQGPVIVPAGGSDGRLWEYPWAAPQ